MSVYGLSQPPYDYEYINMYNAVRSPSTVHAKNTSLAYFFRKYLLMKVFSVFDFTVPENWNESFFKYVLFGFGYVAVINTDKFGVIPQNCTLYGIGVYYQPTNVIIANPLLKGIKTPVIDKQCTLIKCQPNYSGIMDIVSYYADMLAVASESLGINMFNTKLAYVFASENKTQAESFKKMYDEIASGNPSSFVDRKLFRDDGTPNWLMFNQDVKQTYVGLELLETLQKIDNMFDTLVGIPNSNTEKRERMIVDEVNANNFDTQALAYQWYIEINKGMEKTRDMFGIDCSVKLRTPDQSGTTTAAMSEQEAENE